jgi:type VI secretion system protein ImpL
MVKYIVGAVIVLLAWVFAILLEIPYIIPTGITVLVVLVILLLVGIDKLKERRAARDLERAIAAQAAQQAASARPDLQHEIAEMNAEFQKAVAALKTSKKGGKKALYALPWYAIIGPPGSGKSTALRNSGLQFPYLSASGGGVRGLGGTRNCDWWMTSEGVILDTAGRWTSEDEDRDEWLAFLDLTKRFRPEKPMNGIIAAVSVGDLGGAREDEVVNLARRIRERVDEVQGRLQLSLPVYVLFTKCDLIPGFLETFGAMSKEERSQVWGHTAPLTKPIGQPGDYFAQGFDKLISILEVRSLKRMTEERKVADREMVYAFPQQLSVLRQNMVDFVHHLFLENVFKETPRFRGVYFTSGTQEGRPIDRVMSKMAEAFGQQQVQLPAPQVESKSYFLRDMFAKIVFMDSEVAARSPEEVARQRRNVYLAAGAIFLVALGLSGLPAISFARNRSFMRATEDIVDLAHRSTRGTSDEPIDPHVLEPLRTRTMLLEDYDSGAPLFMSMGMYQGEIYEPVRDVYLDIVRRRGIQPLVLSDENEMDAFAGRFEAGEIPSAESMRTNYDRLKLHLIATTLPAEERPRDDIQPALNEELQEFTRRQLTARWRTAAGVRSADREWNLIADNVNYYVDSLANEDVDHREQLYFERNDETIERMRHVFRTVGGLDMAVQGIVSAVDGEGPDITMHVLVGPDVSDMRATHEIPYAFTRQAWDSRVRRLLEHDAARFFGEHWVLGNPEPEDPDEQREMQLAALRSHFLLRYATEWRRFINSLDYVVPHTDAEHVRMLTQLTTGDRMAYERLVRNVDRNLTISETPPERSRTGAVERLAERRAQKLAKQRLGKNAGVAERAVRARAAAMRAGQAPDPNAFDCARVRREFEGFLAFGELPTAEEAAGIPGGQVKSPARRYEEQLEFLRNSLQFRLNGTNVTEYSVVQARAREETARIIAIDIEALWRPFFTRFLHHPLNDAVPLPAAGVTIPAGTVFPAGTQLPTGAVLPPGTQWTPGTILPVAIQWPGTVPLPTGTRFPPGAQVPIITPPVQPQPGQQPGQPAQVPGRPIVPGQVPGAQLPIAQPPPGPLPPPR